MKKLDDKRADASRGRPIKAAKFKLIAVPKKTRLVGIGFKKSQTKSPIKSKHSPKRGSLASQLKETEKPKFVLTASPKRELFSNVSPENGVVRTQPKPKSKAKPKTANLSARPKSKHASNRRPKKLGVSTHYHNNKANILTTASATTTTTTPTMTAKHATAKRDRQSKKKSRQKPLRREINSPLIRKVVQRYIEKANIIPKSGVYRPKSPPEPNRDLSPQNSDSKVSPPKEKLTETRMTHRLSQIAIGKETIGYRIYRIQVSKSKRNRKNATHPQTPNANEDISERRWRGKLSKWRKQLHSYDSRMPDLYKPSVTWFDSHTFPVLTLYPSPRKSPKKSAKKKNRSGIGRSPKRNRNVDNIDQTTEETIEIPQLPPIENCLDLNF